MDLWAGPGFDVLSFSMLIFWFLKFFFFCHLSQEVTKGG